MTHPEKRFQMGRCIASVFANELETSEGHRLIRTVQLQKVYRDKTGRFQYTRTLRKEDLPEAILLLKKAYAYLNSGAQGDQQNSSSL